jgi:hypothetical protein
MIDILNEDVIHPRQACPEPICRNPRTHKPAHISWFYRAMSGVRAVNGQIVKLEVVKTPSGFRTSRQAIHRFVQRLTNPQHLPTATRTRRHSIDAANQQLDAAGI